MGKAQSIVVHVGPVFEDGPAGTEMLYAWLLDEPDLLGHLRLRRPTPPPGAMGAVSEIVLTLTSAGVVGAFARAVTVWLRQLRSDVSVTVAAPDGRSSTVTGHRLRDPEAFLRTIADIAEVPERRLPSSSGDGG